MVFSISFKLPKFPQHGIRNLSKGKLGLKVQGIESRDLDILLLIGDLEAIAIENSQNPYISNAFPLARIAVKTHIKIAV